MAVGFGSFELVESNDGGAVRARSFDISCSVSSCSARVAVGRELLGVAVWGREKIDGQRSTDMLRK